MEIYNQKRVWQNPEHCIYFVIRGCVDTQERKGNLLKLNYNFVPFCQTYKNVIKIVFHFFKL